MRLAAWSAAGSIAGVAAGLGFSAAKVGVTPISLTKSTALASARVNLRILPLIL
jgi:hypothetical protein